MLYISALSPALVAIGACLLGASLLASLLGSNDKNRIAVYAVLGIISIGASVAPNFTVANNVMQNPNCDGNLACELGRELENMRPAE